MCFTKWPRLSPRRSTLQQVFDRITELLRQQFKFDLVVIRMLEKETSTLQLSSLSGQATPGFGQTEHNINLETYIGAVVYHQQNRCHQ